MVIEIPTNFSLGVFLVINHNDIKNIVGECGLGYRP